MSLKASVELATSRSIAGLKVIRTLARRIAMGVALLVCATSMSIQSSAVDEALTGPIRVYVWHETADGHDPVPGVRVFAVKEDGKVAASVFTDANGKVELPNNLDAQNMKYVFAELEGFYVTGLPWQRGSREYELPLHVRVLVNRVSVPVPND